MTAPRKRHPGPPKGSRNAAKPPDQLRSERLALRVTLRQWKSYAGTAADANLSLPDWVRRELDDAAQPRECPDCGGPTRPEWICANPDCPGKPNPGN